MQSFRIPIVLIGCLASATFAAADVCVTCSGPSASYSCAVKKADEIEAIAGAKAILKICAQVLKRKGQHSGCQVVAGDCSGTPITIGWKDVKEALASGDVAADEPAPKAKQATTPPPPAVAPGAAAGAKVRPPDVGPSPSSGSTAPAKLDAAQPADPGAAEPTIGENIKGAAEKTWTCVSSFFGKC